MHSNLKDQKFICRNLMVTIHQKLIIDTTKIKGKESKYNTKEIHQITREESKKRRKEQRRIIETTGK